jgi:predicted transcriptional regulator
MRDPQAGGFEQFGRKVPSIPSDSSIVHAVAVMHHRRLSCLVVTDAQGQAMGLLSRQDVIDEIRARGKAAKSLQAGEILARRRGAAAGPEGWSQVLYELESQNPGITRVHTDGMGRVVI